MLSLAVPDMYCNMARLSTHRMPRFDSEIEETRAAGPAMGPSICGIDMHTRLINAHHPVMPRSGSGATPLMEDILPFWGTVLYLFLANLGVHLAAETDPHLHLDVAEDGVRSAASMNPFHDAGWYLRGKAAQN